MGEWESRRADDCSQRPFPHSLTPSSWEAPVTTVPILRLPMHSTFVLSAGRWLFDAGFGLARARRMPINYLLHAADVVDAVSDPALGSYKFLTQSWEVKRSLYEHMLATLSAAYRLAPTAELVGQIAGRSLKERS